MIDVHCRFSPSESLRVARRLAPLDLYWWEERRPVSERNSPVPSLPSAPFPWRPASSMTRWVGFSRWPWAAAWHFPAGADVAGRDHQHDRRGNIARATGAWIAPHQSGGPVATAVCLQLAACVPNFLIQEHFDPFNAAWTGDLVTWRPTLDPRQRPPFAPGSAGLGVDLNLDVVKEHPYDPRAYFDTHQEGWEKRLGVRHASEEDAQS